MASIAGQIYASDIAVDPNRPDIGRSVSEALAIIQCAEEEVKQR